MEKIFIQFTAPSGTGKSTIAQKLENYFKKNDIPYLSRVPFFKKNTFLFKILQTACLVKFIDFDIFSFFSNPLIIPKENRNLYITEYLKLKYHLHSLKKSNKKVLLYDGGGFIKFAICALLYSEKNEKRVMKFFYKRMPKNSLIIHLDAPPEKVLQRKMKRANACIIKNKEQEEALADINKHCSIRRYMLNKIFHDFNIVSLDGENSAEENAKIIMDKIKKE